MMIDSRRILGGLGVLSLVLLRLAIGWHFFVEGGKKIEYDRHNGGFHLVFSADKEFLDLAKGPLAPLYLSHSKSEHDWRTLLARPRENVPLTPEQNEAQAKWAKEFAQKRADAKKNNQPAPIEFPPNSAAHDWATKIAEDWRAGVDKFKSIAGLTEAQKQAADTALEHRLEELAEYVGDEEAAIVEYRHDLWRLSKWRESPEAGDVPFMKQRITTKNGETNSKLAGWKQQIHAFEDELQKDLVAILSPEQQAQPTTLAAATDSMADTNQHNLDFINRTATIVVIGVGLLLIFGFLTRIAAIVGALFLFGVVASQPFWIAGTAPTMNQFVEMMALLVLAATGAGRWAGMDGCLGALFGRRRVVEVVEA